MPLHCTTECAVQWGTHWNLTGRGQWLCGRLKQNWSEIFLNRCDALDPHLPWSGHHDSGKGVSLSKHGFRAITKLKAARFLLVFSMLAL
ncbi:hypothetical protein Gpo141_00011083 [Globisporangium polare]